MYSAPLRCQFWWRQTQSSPEVLSKTLILITNTVFLSSQTQLEIVPRYDLNIRWRRSYKY